MLIYKIEMPSDLLGELEHLVLLTIIRLGPDTYGIPIVEELRRHASRPILAPSVYLALRRLEAKGLIASRLGRPEARRGGRARRHFEATAAGLELARDSQRMLRRLWDGITLDPLDGVEPGDAR
jgi:DNA-binding PadR family transcriptional regulator